MAEKRMHYYNKRWVRLKRFFLTEIWAVPLLFGAVLLGMLIQVIFGDRLLKPGNPGDPENE